MRRCHQDQIRQRVIEDDTPEMVSTPTDDIAPVPVTGIGTPTEIVPGAVASTPDLPVVVPEPQPLEQSLEQRNLPALSTTTSDSNEQRYPRRERKPREHFEPVM